jgi:hypothetical protein
MKGKRPEKAVRRRGRVAVAGSAFKRVKRMGKKKEELTTDELILLAWKKTYENRHHKLDA